MNRKMPKSRYRPLKWALFRRTCWVLPAAGIATWLARALVRGSLGNLLVQTLQSLFGLKWDIAYEIYDRVIRQNLPLIYGLSIFVLVLLFSWVAIRGILRYFEAVSRGLTQLEQESEEPILLPTELEFLEKQMEQVRLSIKQKALDAKLSEQRKNDLVVYLAHDIKTPLTSVIGYLSLLEEAPDLPPEQKAKYVGITLKKALRLEQLVDEFFEITRFNLQSIVLHLEKVDLTFLLQQMADEATPLMAPDRKRAAVEAPPITLEGDPDKLARVFQNILKNAIAYSCPNSVIRILAKIQEDFAQVDMINQGSPIPPDMLERIFEKFYRLDSARSTRTGGAGLGLAIAKEIVEAHGGTISAQSGQEGTRFTVRIPLKQKASSENSKIRLS